MDKLSLLKEAIRHTAIIEFMYSDDFGYTTDADDSKLFQKITNQVDEKVKDDLRKEYYEQLQYLANIIQKDRYARLVLLQPDTKIEKDPPEAAIIGKYIKYEEDLSLPKEQLFPHNVLYNRDKEDGKLIKTTISYEPVFIELYNRPKDIPAKEQIIDRFTNSVMNLSHYYGGSIRDQDILLISDDNLNMRAYYYENNTFYELDQFIKPNLKNRIILNMDVGVECMLLGELGKIGEKLDLDLLSLNNYEKRYDELFKEYLLLSRDHGLDFGDEKKAYVFHPQDVMEYLNCDNKVTDIYKAMIYKAEKEFLSNVGFKSMNEWKNLINKLKGQEKNTFNEKEKVTDKDKSFKEK